MSKQDIQNKVPVKSVSGMTNFNEVVQGDVYTKLDDLNFILANNSPGLVLLPLPAPTITGLSILYYGMGDASFTVTWNYEGNPTAYIFYIENDTTTFTQTITPTSNAAAFTNKSMVFVNGQSQYIGDATLLKVKMVAQISGRLTSQSTVVSAHSISIVSLPPLSSLLSIRINLNEEYTDLNTSFTYILNNIEVSPSDIAVTVDTPTYRNVAIASRLPNTGYTIKVKALKGIVETISNGLFITTMPAPPTQITNISSNSITSSGFTISWSGGTGVNASYTYTLNGNAETPSSSTAQSATFTALAFNTAYSVIVSASNYSGTIYSSPLSVTTLILPPTQITNSAPTSITSSAFTVNWTGGTGATSYTYTINGSAATPSSASSLLGTAQSATFTGRAAGTTYSVIVTAVNDGGSAVSSPFSVTTSYPLPPAPTNININNFGVNGAYADVTVSFTTSAAAAWYQFYYTARSGPAAGILSGISGTSSPINIFGQLYRATTYDAYLRAFNQSGQYTDSSNIVFTTSS